MSTLSTRCPACGAAPGEHCRGTRYTHFRRLARASRKRALRVVAPDAEAAPRPAQDAANNLDPGVVDAVGWLPSSPSGLSCSTATERSDLSLRPRPGETAEDVIERVMRAAKSKDDG